MNKINAVAFIPNQPMVAAQRARFYRTYFKQS
ncbi:Uncharacterised protein [Vibrio cholerae]|nr:Uncharacterised protein [Vibrio cholerae]